MKQYRIMHRPCKTRRFTICWEEGDKALWVVCPKCRQRLVAIAVWAALEPQEDVIQKVSTSPIIEPKGLIIVPS